jgi:hypothetical protein
VNNYSAVLEGQRFSDIVHFKIKEIHLSCLLYVKINHYTANCYTSINTEVACFVILFIVKLLYFVNEPQQGTFREVVASVGYYY